MEDKYGVKIENRYALFLGSDDEENNENVLEGKSAKGKEATTASSGTKAAASKADAKARPATGGTQAQKKAPLTTGGNTIATGKGIQAQQGDNRPRPASGAPRAQNDGQSRNQGGNNQERGPRPRRFGEGRFEGNESRGEGHRGGFGGGGSRGGRTDRPREPRPPREPREPRREGGERPEGDNRPVRRFGGPRDRPFADRHDAAGDEQQMSHDNRNTAEGDNTQDTEYRPRGGEQREFGEYRGGERSFYRGGGRGRGGYRGRDDGSGYDNRGKRVYERHSGTEKTGVKPIEKKEGAGQHNWGSMQEKDIMETFNPDAANEFKDENEQLPVEASEEQGEYDQSGRGGYRGGRGFRGGRGGFRGGYRGGREEREPELTEEERAAREEERRKEAAMMTLEEYKKAEQERLANKPQLNIRKPGEGEDKSWQKNLKLVHESTKKSDLEQSEESRKKAKSEEVDPLTQTIFESMRFEVDRTKIGGRGPRDRDDREGGPRGGGRGGYGGDRGYGGRGPRNQQRAPEIKDENAFPALGAGKAK